MDLLHSLETEKERLALAHQLRQFVKNRPGLIDYVPKPMTWEAWAIETPDKPRAYYQLWLYGILTTCKSLDTYLGPLCEFATSDGSCRAWVGQCKNPHGFKHYVSAPEIFPGSGTRHKTLEEAVRWAKGWIDMRERLLRNEL